MDRKENLNLIIKLNRTISLEVKLEKNKRLKNIRNLTEFYIKYYTFNQNYVKNKI